MMESALVAGAGALWLTSLGWLVGTWSLALLQPIRRRRARSPAPLPPVSIIMPTSAVEDAGTRAGRLATLGSLLEVEAGESEIVVCVDRGEPPVVLAEELAARSDRVRVIGAGEPSSANAKVDAMAR